MERSRVTRAAFLTVAAFAFAGCFAFDADKGPIEIGGGSGGASSSGGGSGSNPHSEPFDASWCGPERAWGRRLTDGVDLTAISAYQAVEVPLMASGQRVQPQNADVVQQRALLVRAFIRLKPGAPGKSFGARLLLSVGKAEAAVYEDFRTLQADSTKADLESTFDFFVPAEEVKNDQDFAVEVFDEGACAAAPSAGLARFPATGASALKARATGEVHVVLVPIRYDADGSRRLPDVSASHVADMKGLLSAVFPVNGVELSVRKAVATRETEFGNILNQMLQLRELDSPASDVAYFGLVNMADTMDEYCRGGCVAGVATFGTPAGGSAAGVGIGFRGPAQETFVHELGHVHRLMHSPCGGAAGPDPNYPYGNALLGSWGYDLRQGLLIDPGSQRRDFMSYCDPSWISDYNYQLLVERLALVNGRRYTDANSELADIVVAPGAVAPQAISPALSTPATSGTTSVAPTVYRTLRLRSGGGLHWGAPLATRSVPPGDPELAEVLDASGRLVTKITAFRQELSDGQGALWFLPQPEAGWDRIVVQGQAPISWALAPAVAAFDPVD